MIYMNTMKNTFHGQFMIYEISWTMKFSYIIFMAISWPINVAMKYPWYGTFHGTEIHGCFMAKFSGSACKDCQIANLI